ncbi:diguanylate cyclase [Xanthomonadaceae bacterium XH05]|nr:diguanylate cyclase [Xanthomonadaceae bacterium XH05]
MVVSFSMASIEKTRAIAEGVARAKNDATELARNLEHAFSSAAKATAGVAAILDSLASEDREEAARDYAARVMASDRPDGLHGLGFAGPPATGASLDWVVSTPDSPDAGQFQGQRLGDTPAGTERLSRSARSSQFGVLRLASETPGFPEYKALVMPVSSDPDGADGFAVAIIRFEGLMNRLVAPSLIRVYHIQVRDLSEYGHPVVFNGGEHGDARQQASAVARIGDRHWQIDLNPAPGLGTASAGRTKFRQVFIPGMLASLVLAWIANFAGSRVRRRRQRWTLANRLDTVFRNHPHAVYYLDANRRFVNVNDKGAMEFGMPREDLIGRPSDDLIHPEHRDIADQHWQAALQGEAAAYDAMVIAADGRELIVRLVLVPILEGDTVAGVLGVAENITEKRQQEAELDRSRAMLQSVVDNLPLMVFWKDRNGRYEGCNHAFAASLGKTLTEIVGRTDHELIAHAEADLYRQEDLNVLRGAGDLISAIVDVEQRDGSHRFIRTSKVALRSPDGMITGLLGVAEDFTTQVQLERELEHRAWHDPLTGLANRAKLEEHLTMMVARADRGLGRFGLLYFDVDRFKAINDTHGHEAGDEVIRTIATRVASTVRSVDLVARLGGDEFVAVLDGVDDSGTLLHIGQVILKAVTKPVVLSNGETIQVATSIGGALHAVGLDSNELLHEADVAMYQAKESGRGQIVVAWRKTDAT